MNKMQIFQNTQNEYSYIYEGDEIIIEIADDSENLCA